MALAGHAPSYMSAMAGKGAATEWAKDPLARSTGTLPARKHADLACYFYAIFTQAIISKSHYLLAY